MRRIAVFLIAAMSLQAAVKVEKVAYKGWANCYRVSNGEIEAIVTSDVGPRVIRFGFIGGQNMFKEYAEQLGKSEDACRFLSAAEQVRQRAGSPLFSFWFRHNESAGARLRSTLGPNRYEGLAIAGARMRTEDVINEAAERLREFGAMPAV